MDTTTRDEFPSIAPVLRELHERHSAVWQDDRPAHYGSVTDEHHLLRESCGWLDFSGDAKLELTGEDRNMWLQGQLTNDVRPLTDGASLEACLLSATGQIVSTIDAWAQPDQYVLLFPGSRCEAAIKRLEQMLILEDVQIRDASDSLGIVSVQGPEASRVLGEMIELPRLDAGSAEFKGQTFRLLRHDRTGSGGWDILFPADAAKSVVSLLKQIAPVGDDAWEIARIEAGLPLIGKDISDRTLAMEMGKQFEARRISHTKGCYTGQEVVMRIYSRGHTNRTWMGLVGEERMPAGAPVSHPRRADAGVITSSAISPEYGPIAAAMLRNEARPGDRVSVSTPGGQVEAEVFEMPIRSR